MAAPNHPVVMDENDDWYWNRFGDFGKPMVTSDTPNRFMNHRLIID